MKLFIARLQFRVLWRTVNVMYEVSRRMAKLANKIDAKLVAPLERKHGWQNFADLI